MLRLSTALAWCGLLALAGAASAAEVLEMTDDNLNATITSNQNVLVMFYAPWCGACRRFKPEFQWAAETAEEENIPLVFGRMHVDDYADTTASFGLTRFPSWVLFNGSTPSRIHNPFSGQALMTQVRSYFGLPLGSAARELQGLGGTTDWLFWRGNDFSTMQSAVMGFFPDPAVTGEPLADPEGAALLREAFHAASISMVESVRFGWTASPEVLAAFHLPTDRPVIALYKDYDEGKQLFSLPRSVQDGAGAVDTLVQWVHRNNIPLSTSIDHYNIRDLQRNKNLILHVFVPEAVTEHPTAKARLVEAVSSAVLPLEQEGLWARGDLTVGVTNGQKYYEWLPMFGLSRGRFPSFGLSDPINGQFYGQQLSEEEEAGALLMEELVTPKGGTEASQVVALPKDALQGFLRGYFKGTLTPVPSSAQMLEDALPDHPLAAMAMLSAAEDKVKAAAAAAEANAEAAKAA